jgi:GDP-D-mannose dehydratase
MDGARAIYEGRQSLLELGNLEVVREWGLSSDYMEAISRVGSLERPARLIISSGKPKKLKEFVERVFGRFNLDYKKFVVYNKELGRKWEIKKTHCDVTQAKLLIDWEATCGIEEIVDSYLYPPPPQQ